MGVGVSQHILHGMLPVRLQLFHESFKHAATKGRVLLQASREAIHAVVSALALTVDLASVFQGVSRGAVYSLRTIVCYFGHHYQASPWVPL